MSPQVSVLLTSYSRPVMLREAIESVLVQTFTDFELIILDDNSPEDGGVPEVLLGYWGHPKVALYKSAVQPGERRERVRYAAQANTGLAIAAGEYVTYLCDDDWYYPDRLERMVAVLDDPGRTVCYGSQHLANGAGDITGTRPAHGVLNKASGIVDHSSVMHTAAAGRQVGGWPDDPGMWNMADAYFWDRLTQAGHVFYPVPGGPTDAHRYHAGDSSAWGPALYGAHA